MYLLFSKASIWTVAAAALLPSLANAQPSADRKASGKPTVVLVHGTFADGTSSWAQVIQRLQAKGIRVVAVQNPCRSLKDDVATTKRLIDMQPGPVILVGHSWGGTVITEAGNNRKVKLLVYVAAFAPAEGESVNALGKGKPPPYASSLRQDAAGYLYVSVAGIHRYFAQDLPLAGPRLAWATQVPPKANIFGQKVTKAAWRHKPSWFIVARNDRAIGADAERAMAKRIGATTTAVNSSHFVMLAKPQAVNAVILDAVKHSGGNR